jgi:DNA-binding FrmR family transcriptional regulator
MVKAGVLMATTQLIPEWKVVADEIWATLGRSTQIHAEIDEQLKKNAKDIENLNKTVDRVTGNIDGLNRSNENLNKTVDRVTGNVDGLSRSMEDLKKTVDRVTGNVGGLNRSLGELIETLIAARLWEKFPDYNLKRAYQRVPIFDENNRIMTDIDILLSNTGLVMAVEVKRELDRIRDVDEHLKRLELIRKYPPAEVVGKKILGAMAGGLVDADVQRYAYESGFFVLELAGESVRLVPQPEGFVPKQW